MTSAAPHEFLTPSAKSRAGDDPIFALNAEASRRAKAGERILNATLGALTDDAGLLVTLPAVCEALRRVDERRAAAYAPIAGEASFLSGVIADVFSGTGAESKAIGVATPGGTGALNLAAVSFLDPGMSLLSSHFYWGPYETIAAHTGRKLATFPTFDERGRFHVQAFSEALQRVLARQGRALVFLNTPCHNPTGYSLDATELEQTAAVLREKSALGPIILLLDTAYASFGPKSGAAWNRTLVELSDSVQVLVAWSGSKAFAQYGARIGALVALAPQEQRRRELQGALSFACRGTWSNCNHAGMLAVAEILANPSLKARVDAERERAIRLLNERVQAFNEQAQAKGLKYPRYEGGFFVTVFTPDAERTSKSMQAEGVFVVPLKGAVRIALCSTPASEVPRLVAALESGVRLAELSAPQAS